MSLTWLLIAAAVWLGAGNRADTDAGTRAACARPRLSRRRLELLAACSVSVACLAALGAIAGAVAAAVAAPLAVAVVRRAEAKGTGSTDDLTLPLALDLVAVTLRTGQPLDAALLLAGPAAGSLGAPLTRVGGLLRLGADPAEAWTGAHVHPALAAVAATARRSASSGIRLAAAYEDLAADLRAQGRARAEARAQRVGVLAAGPLGLCFLPAFVCLGIVPAFIGLASDVLR